MREKILGVGRNLHEDHDPTHPKELPMSSWWHGAFGVKWVSEFFGIPQTICGSLTVALRGPGVESKSFEAGLSISASGPQQIMGIGGVGTG